MAIALHLFQKYIMKLSYKLILFSYLFFLLPNFINAQGFEGEIVCLIYNEKIDERLQELGEMGYGIDFFSQNDSSESHYLIKAAQLTEFNQNKKGEMRWESQQKNDTAYVLFPSGKKINYVSLQGKEANLKVVKKYKGYKNILGFKCRKIEYEDQNDSGVLKIITWIAEDFPHDKEMQSTMVFRQLFFPHGLALEKRVIFKNMEIVTCVTKVIHRNIKDEEFDFFSPTSER